MAPRIFDSMWDGAHVDQVDILWEETLALEGRAAFYDRTGALKDVLQNHMLEILCQVAMEPPADGGLHDRKLDVLRSVRPLTIDDAISRTRRARYTAGRLAGSGGADGRPVPAYADEDGVDPTRGTETFGEVVLELDTERWTGTRFVLRAGKAMAARRKGVVLRFRPVSRSWFGGDAAPAGEELRIGLDGPHDITLHLTGNGAGLPPRPVPLALTGPPPASALSPYAHVLLDILHGGNSRSVRGDEAEEAWRVVAPVLEAWAQGRVPLEEYPAGSTGPPRIGAGGRSAK